MKTCYTCKKDFPPNGAYFVKATENIDGLTGRCKSCIKEHRKKHRKENREYYKEYRKKDYQKNKEYYKEYREKYHKENAEYYREYSKKYRKENKENIKKWRRDNTDKISKNLREYRQKNIEYFKEYDKKYRRENSDKVNQNDAKRRALILKATVGVVDYEEIKRRDDMNCYLCKNDIVDDNYHFDHVYPLSKGGAHSMDNIKVTHARCNLIKKDKILRDVEDMQMQLNI